MSVFLWLVAIGVFPSPLNPVDNFEVTGDGNVLNQIAWVALLGFVWIVARLNGSTRIAVFPVLLALTLTWFALSVTWAIDPSIAVRRLFLTVIVAWLAFKIVGDLGYDEVVRTICVFMAVTVAANFAAIAVNGNAIQPTGEWRGLINNKNFAGAVCATAIIVFVLGGQKMNGVLRAVAILGTLAFLVKTQSKTSLGLLPVSIGIGMAYQPIKRWIGVILFLLALAVPVAFLYTDEIARALEPLSEPEALTGRGQIWPVLIAYAKDNPLFGSGYGSFWNIGAASPFYSYSRNWMPPHGHNGYLDLAASVGIPGLLLAVFACFIAPLRVLLTRDIPTSHGRLLLASIVFTMLHNVTETTLLDRSMYMNGFLMIVVALVYDERERKAVRSTRPSFESAGLRRAAFERPRVRVDPEPQRSS